jgi:hypothetical protein
MTHRAAGVQAWVPNGTLMASKIGDLILFFAPFAIVAQTGWKPR